MTENKVTFGLEKVHYAPYAIVDGKPVFETPVAIPGAVEITMDPKGELNEFFADNVVYYVSNSNQGYEGNLNIAVIPESFATDCLGEEKDEVDGVIHEISDAVRKPFALLFQFEGDVKAVRRVLYNVTANRPSISSSTKTDSTEPNVNELPFVASPIEIDGKKMVKTKTSSTTPDNVYDAWYTKVYEKIAGA